MDIPGVDLPGPGDIIGGIGGFFGGLAEDAGQAIVEYVVEFIFGLIAQAIASITSALAGAFNGDSTRVDLTGGWFASDGGSTVTTMTSVIAGSLVLVFLFLSLIRAMAAGEFSTMWRAALIDVPVAFLATALTVVVASALLAMVDEASATLLGSDGEQLAVFGESLTDVEQLSVAGLLGILFGLLFIIGAVLVWIQLLVRAALIYIVIAFAPITWVTRAYPGTRGIARRGAISDLTDEQLRAPSRLPGWSRSHVIAHVALNAEGSVAVAEAPDDQRPALMYPGGTAARDRDIEQLSQAPRDELLRRSHHANIRFTSAWDPAPEERECATAQDHPTFSSSTILQRRLRELQVHSVDLDVESVGVDAWLPAFVDTDLNLQWPTVAQRTSENVSVVDEFGVVWETVPLAAGQTRRVVGRRRLLAWVLDRSGIEAMPQLESWSNRSKWEWLSPES